MGALFEAIAWWVMFNVAHDDGDTINTKIIEEWSTKMTQSIHHQLSKHAMAQQIIRYNTLTSTNIEVKCWPEAHGFCVMVHVYM